MTRPLLWGAAPALAAFVLLAAPADAAPADAAPADTVARYTSAHGLAAKLDSSKDGMATYAIPTGPAGTVLIVKRERTGAVEVHDALADEFIVQSGRASVLIGRPPAGRRQTAPGEWRGGEIAGGERFDMGPGDVLWIPAGAAHQVQVPEGGSFIYYAVKFPAKAPPPR